MQERLGVGLGLRRSEERRERGKLTQKHRQRSNHEQHKMLLIRFTILLRRLLQPEEDQREDILTTKKR